MAAHGQRSLSGYSPRGGRVGHNLVTKQQQQQQQHEGSLKVIVNGSMYCSGGQGRGEKWTPLIYNYEKKIVRTQGLNYEHFQMQKEKFGSIINKVPDMR